MHRNERKLAALTIALMLGPSAALAASHSGSANVLVVPTLRGGGWGGGITAALKPERFPSYTFTAKTPEDIFGPDDLADYDTLILLEFCSLNSAAYATLQGLIVDWVQIHKGKILIWDSDSCVSSSWYGWLSALGADFDRRSPGQYGKGVGSLTILEESHLGSVDPTSPYYLDTSSIASQTDAVGDLNTVYENTVTPNWCAQMRGTTVEGRAGYAVTYTRIGTLTGAPESLIVYCGLDNEDWNDGTPGADALLKIMELQLAHGWGPPGSPEVADLRCQVPIGNLVLMPSSQTAPVGQQQSVVATVTWYNRPIAQTEPVPGTEVTFTVTAGPNAGQTFTGIADANGQVTFSYVGTQTGTDTVTATCVVNYSLKSVDVPIDWTSKIDAVDDQGIWVVGAVGGTSVNDVLANDTLDGTTVDPAQTTLTFVSSTDPAVTLSSTSVVVAPGTKQGNYSLVYQICPTANPLNCDQATVTVPVSAALIAANGDQGAEVNGAKGGMSVANVLGNDTLGGVPVNVGQVNLTLVSTDDAVTLSGTEVDVAAGTKAGTYSLTYKICEILNPTNCSTAKVTVPVKAPLIDAVDDVGGSVNGSQGGTSVLNVLANDMLDGVIVDSTKVTTTLVASSATGVVLSDRRVTVTPGTQAGTYTLTYKICEILNPDNCDQANVTVPVTAAPIKANDDVGNSVIGATGGLSFPYVLGNDTFNGGMVDPTKVTLTFLSSTSLNVVLSGYDVYVLPGTPMGYYALNYQICEILNPSNCSSAIVWVTVTAAPIFATNDVGTPLNGAIGGTSVANVLLNDKLNGVAPDATQITTTQMSTSNPGVSLVGTNVEVAPETPAGSQTLVYTICENLNPTNCATATVTVPVTAPVIDAVNDAGSPVNGIIGGTSLTNVLGNDTLNGVLVNAAKVTLTVASSTSTGVTLVGTDVVVAAATPAGSYTIEYKICEILNPTNCDTAAVSVPVTAAVIAAVNDTGNVVLSAIGGTSAKNVLANDTLNGAAVDPNKVTTTVVSSINPRVTLSGTDVVVALGTAEGSYTLTYQICEKLNPTNCSTATVLVPVTTLTKCAAGSFSFTGSDGTTGFPGLLKSYNLNGVNVNVSAWARSKLLGNYYPAYVGAYSNGLGVTDIIENGSNNTHAVDNNGTEDNYLMFEFDHRIAADQAYLGFVATDSDVSVWYGDAPGGVNPFMLHQSLNASMLNGLTTETNLGANATRWADINPTSKLGNVLVVAAKIGDIDDYIKLQNLQFGCPPPLAVACPSSTGTVRTAYNSSLVASGGTGPYSYAIQSGALPAGLSDPNSSTGAVTGAPTAAGTYTFTAKATDLMGTTVTQTCSMTIAPLCTAGTLAFTGSDAAFGTAGNIKTYTMNGVNVKVSAWRRNKTSGTFYTAYAGAYSNGLGVTDSTELLGLGNTNALDNNGTEDNYLLFEFDQRVVSDQVYLGFVATDSDVSVWYGDVPGGVNPFTTHQTLSTSLLSGLTTETNLGTNAVRWADINATSKAGNLLVVAAKIADTDDYVKVQNLKYGCP